MGCVPSRCLYCYTPGSSRNQHHGRGRRISILRSVSTPLRKRRSHGHHHHHFVALTSTTYGLLRWNSNASSSPAGTDVGNDTEELMMTPMDDDRSSSQETPFFDTASVSNYEDCCTCTDKEVVGVVHSSSKGPLDATGGNCLDVSGAASVSSSSSCVNKLVSLDQFCQQQKQQLQQLQQFQQQPEVINIWELMEGLEEDCSRSLLSPCSSPSLRMKSPLGRHPGKRRFYHRSVSLSAMQATKKLDSILTVEGISPATLERVLKEIYSYYVNSRCRNLLNKPFSSSTPCSPASKQNTSTPKKLKPRPGKENSTPKFDKSPVCFDKSLFPSFRRKERSCSNSPFRSRPVNATENAIEKEPLGFSFSFFKQESQGDSRPRTPPITRKQQGMVTPRTPASPLLARRKSRGESPLFRTAATMLDKSVQQQQQQLKKKVSCCNCCCCKNNSEKSNNNNNSNNKEGSGVCVKKSLGSGSFFDPELLASIERAFKSLSVEDWYSSREEDLGGASDDSSSTSNEEVPLMGAAKRSVTNSKGNKTPPAAATPTSPGFGLWDSFWALRDGLAASSTAKKISFSKISPLDHHQEEQQQQQQHEEEEGSNPLDSFELRCPPGGESSVVLYCTSLRGIRKTFEECHNLQMILRSTGVCIDERDVSMHSDFRLELKELLNNEEPGSAASVPKVFIKGRYIGGAEEVRKLHEEGKLVRMLEGIPKEDPFSVCDGCGGLRFIPCLECSGSCKLVLCEKGMNKVSRCPDCNENGLIRCPICC